LTNGALPRRIPAHTKKQLKPVHNHGDQHSWFNERTKDRLILTHGATKGAIGAVETPFKVGRG